MVKTDTEYSTVAQFATAEITEKRSRFIGYCKEVKSEEEARDFISEIKAKHYDARHNCSAYVVRNGNICRYSDDGEPQGTAGMPILNVIQKQGLTDCVVVVTRYFGGILLGTGGLVRAYSQSAAEALNKAQRAEYILFKSGILVCDYNRYGKIPDLVSQFSGNVANTEFAENVSVEILIPKGSEESFSTALTEFSNGDLSVQFDKEVFAKKKLV